MRKIALAVLLLAAASCTDGFTVQETVVGEGYAATSVNTAVFRAGSLTSDGRWQLAAYYDADGYVVVARREAGAAAWSAERTGLRGRPEDAHNVVSIGLDGAGYVHLSWDQHSSSLRYARSRTPYGTDFEELPVLVDAEKERDVTYPEFHRFSDGSLLFAFRQGISGAGNLVLYRYEPGTRAWSCLQDRLLDGEGRRNAYWQMYLDAHDVIHLSWVWRETWDVATNHDLCYAASDDGGRSWHDSRGAGYALPITQASAEVAWAIPQRSELINQTSMTADEAGHPCIATYWREAQDSIPQYRVVYHDGAGWQCRQVGARHTPFSLSGGGTKSIPVSRPQILAGSGRMLLFFRDVERGSRASVAISRDGRRWTFRDLTEDSLDAWEPTLDYEGFRRDGRVHLFVQRASQGDGERTVATPPQPVRILSF